MRKALTFDDVALVPQFNNIDSRIDTNFSTWITTKTRSSIPIIPANMDTVINDKLAIILLENGGFPIFHRFTNEEQQIKWAEQFVKNGYGALSIGLLNFDLPYKDNTKLQFVEKLANEHGVNRFCIDIAHGHSKKMLDQISWMKTTWPDMEVIAGNVCTAMAYQDLVNAGADAVKVGVGSGASCTTRMVTGFGVSQFSAIQDCAQIAKKLRVPLIADGGIRNSRDIVLSLAAGASSVMVGKLFALTEESAAQKRDVYETPEGKESFSQINTFAVPNNFNCHAAFIHNSFKRREAKYRGQASEDFQKDYFGGLKTGTVAEGESFWASVSGTAQSKIDELLGGIRSGMTYGGARDIKELQVKAEFVETTNSYMAESNTRKS